MRSLALLRSCHAVSKTWEYVSNSDKIDQILKLIFKMQPQLWIHLICESLGLAAVETALGNWSAASSFRFPGQARDGENGAQQQICSWTWSRWHSRGGWGSGVNWKLKEDLLTSLQLPKSIQVVVQKMDTGSSERCRVNGQEEKVTSCGKVDTCWKYGTNLHHESR